MTRVVLFISIMVSIITSGCHDRSAKDENDVGVGGSVTATVETDPVQEPDDAADDPAIWIHPEDPSKSRVIGTNKKRGLNVYHLDGTLSQSFDCGRINNVDIRNGFPLLDETIDFAAGSNRTDNTITLVRINRLTGELTDIAARKITSQLDEVYGFCLYHDKQNNRFYAFMNGKSGGIEQWYLFSTPDRKMDAQLVRTFQVNGQPEGCVADDDLGWVYIGEENKGIWKFNAHPDSSDARVLVDDVSSHYLQADIEGLTIYYAADQRGYLIVSSQGNNSYAIYDRTGHNAYLGSFVIVDGLIDGTSDTDGIDVSHANLGPLFPRGVFVAQDGHNYDGPEKANQNFKLVPWEQIAATFTPPLL